MLSDPAIPLIYECRFVHRVACQNHHMFASVLKYCFLTIEWNTHRYERKADVGKTQWFWEQEDASKLLVKF